MTDMSEKTLSLTSFTVINEGTNQSVSVTTKSLDVKIIGTKSQLNSLNVANITAVVDMSEKADNFIGMTEMPVKININSKFNQCWSYGSYTVNVTAARKSDESGA